MVEEECKVDSEKLEEGGGGERERERRGGRKRERRGGGGELERGGRREMKNGARVESLVLRILKLYATSFKKGREKTGYLVRGSEGLGMKGVLAAAAAAAAAAADARSGRVLLTNIVEINKV
ncbi:hypothetical protein Pcinc_014906 [Petrolisthes cinctipes]|uniref:Uncharacterized protein n=1 Tax=Petrolisthes cinctipes TaxID=88211 RepID=A0AAE1KRC1_PETCI|nr:hypothetical protein Pcinc_014906 [Petrolisthes cinctipes]